MSFLLIKWSLKINAIKNAFFYSSLVKLVDEIYCLGTKKLNGKKLGLISKH